MTKKTAPKKKKDKKPKPVRDYLTYLGLRAIIALMMCFPVERNLKTARFFGRQLWKRYHRGRKRALDNLRASFPEKDDQWLYKTGKRSFEQLAMLAVDVFFSPKIVKKSNYSQFSRYVNCERAKWIMKEEKGLILVGAHYANFEIIGYLLGLFGFNIYSVARPLDNPYISQYLYSVREKHNQKIIDKKGASQLMPQIIKEGATIAFIADQDAGRKGIFVDFFGRKASTYKSIGLLAITENLPICIGYSRRIGDRFFFEIGMKRLITPDEWQDKDDPLLWVTQEYTKAIEKFIREDPTQYWWLHRRWKHRPKEEQKQKTSAIRSS